MGAMLDVDYLVVGAGASGMAFVDSLIDHSDATVVIVDRRDEPGGHWNSAYPFVRLHQASLFYGVASTPLGDGTVQTAGPERGLQERATGAQVRQYYRDVMRRRLAATGRVTFLGAHDYRGGGRIRDLGGDRDLRVRPGCRIVDARFLSPVTPADRPPPFAVAPDVSAVPVARLPVVADAHDRFVIVGSGKTATDACVWLLTRGVDPGTIRWVRPREPWMLDRARVQPDPAVAHALAADTWEAAAAATDLDRLFLGLEERGVLVRIDRTASATMAKTPTLGRGELDLLRSIEDVVRLGHVRAVTRSGLACTRGRASIAGRALVVDCAADGLPRPDTRPVWTAHVITLQPIRAGFPCFGAALVGYVEATRPADDAVKNALCPPTPYGDTRAQWAEMTARGAKATAAFMAEPDIAAWSHGVALNPARIPPGYGPSMALDEALARVERYVPAGLARLEELAAAKDVGGTPT